MWMDINMSDAEKQKDKKEKAEQGISQLPKVDTYLFLLTAKTSLLTVDAS